MGHQPQLPIAGEEDAALLHEAEQGGGIPLGQAQEHHVGLHLFHIERDAWQGSQPLCQTPGAAMIVHQPGDVLIQGKKCGLGQDPSLAHAAPQHLAQPSGPRDEAMGTHQQ